MNAPVFNTEYICIVDRKHLELAAVVSSYLHIENTFLSVFEYSSSTIEKPEVFTETIDEHTITRKRSGELAVKIYNAINRIGDIKNVVLVGLDEKQKSYLFFLNEYNIIEINSVDEVDSVLGGFAYYKEGYLYVRPDEIVKGLFWAGKKNMKLRIDINAKALNFELNEANGLVVVENDDRVSVVSAVNYALSSSFNLEIINPVSESEIANIDSLIKDWRDGVDLRFNQLKDVLRHNLGDIDFSVYECVTFFTEGFPYSLALENAMPITYVHLNHYPGLFIVNNIYFEKQKRIGSAVVFSPLEFGADEETMFVIDAFRKQNYWVKDLVGKSASAHNIDMHVKEYPYDVFHICSHGGEVDGFGVVKEFVDRNGDKHVVEYDDVISFYPQKGKELIKVEYKHIWRKFNGFVWKSEDLKSQNYPNYVFVDMYKAIMRPREKGHKYEGKRKGKISESCAVKCYDFTYQAMFDMIAGFHTAPIIFNNTCWSWSGIVDSFLNAGVRGYIGTIWDVRNDVAKSVAESFYQYSFGDTVANSLYRACVSARGTESEDIYVYWGLHFSTLGKTESVASNRLNIAEALFQSFSEWRRRAMKMPDDSVKENMELLSEWNKEELGRSFLKESLQIINSIKYRKGK